MSTVNVRLPESLHQAAKNLAAKEDIPLNQLITLALAEKLSALTTEDYLSERARRASKTKYRKVLAKVPDVLPDEQDRL